MPNRYDLGSGEHGENPKPPRERRSIFDANQQSEISAIHVPNEDPDPPRDGKKETSSIHVPKEETSEVTNQLLPELLAGVRQELIQILEEAEGAEHDSRRLRDAVRKIRDFFKSLISSEDLRAIISGLASPVQGDIRAAELDIDDLVSRLAKVLSNTKYYQPPPPARVAVRKALEGLDRIVQPVAAENDVREVLEALDALHSKLDELLNEWDDADETWPERARSALRQSLKTTELLAVASALDYSKSEVIEALKSSGIGERAIALSVITVAMAQISYRIIETVKDKGDLTARHDSKRTRTQIADKVSMYTSAVSTEIQRPEPNSIYLKAFNELAEHHLGTIAQSLPGSHKDPAFITLAGQLTTIDTFAHGYDTPGGPVHSINPTAFDQARISFDKRFRGGGMGIRIRGK